LGKLPPKVTRHSFVGSDRGDEKKILVRDSHEGGRGGEQLIFFEGIAWEKMVLKGILPRR